MGEYLEEGFSILGCDQTSRANLKTEEGGFPAPAFKVSNKWAILIIFHYVAVIDVCFEGDGEFNNDDPFQMVPDKGEIRFEVSGNNFNGDGKLGN